MSPCMNCNEREATTHWAGVLVCGDCAKMATTIYQRNERQLRALLGLLHDKIRVMLVKGKLRPELEVHRGSDDREVQAPVHPLSEGPGAVQQQEPNLGDND